MSPSAGAYNHHSYICASPNYLGDVHRGWVRFNIAGIPDASNITDVDIKLRSNYGGAVGTISINDVTGTIGPYGAYSAAVYNDLGNGFFYFFLL